MTVARNERQGAASWAGWGRKLSYILFPIVFLLAVSLGIVCGPWRVIPPANVQTSGVAYLSDYGKHSRLALQVDRNVMLEYSFGDWRYFALGERSVWRGLMALAGPTQAGLGRRSLPFVDNESAFNEITGAKRSVRLEVDQTRVDELLFALQERYERNLRTGTVAVWTDFTFVQDEVSYHLFWNSNHETASWLRELGCEVRGTPLLSNFRVEGASAARLKPRETASSSNARMPGGSRASREHRVRVAGVEGNGSKSKFPKRRAM